MKNKTFMEWEQMNPVFEHCFNSIFHCHFEQTVNEISFNVRVIRGNIFPQDAVERWAIAKQDSSFWTHDLVFDYYYLSIILSCLC